MTTQFQHLVVLGSFWVIKSRRMWIWIVSWSSYLNTRWKFCSCGYFMPNDHRRQISLLVDECDYWWPSKADLLNNCESKHFLQWRSMTVGLGFFLCCLACRVQYCKNNFLQTAYRSPSPPPVCFLMLAINCALKKIFAFFPLLFSNHFWGESHC